MNAPKVSVCVPTYNGREHLEACVRSIRAQTFADFEVLLCDDQSGDGTLELARALAQGDPRFRFVANPRRFGLVGNWNNCVRLARGEWVKFVFQDDLVAPSCIERLLGACERSGRPFGFCGRDFLFEGEVDTWLREWFLSHQADLDATYGELEVIEPLLAVEQALRRPEHNVVGEPTVTLIRRSLFEELGPFDAALIQLCDAEFWWRILTNRGAARVAARLATFRIHGAGTTLANHGARAYRTRVLDPLVIRYRFAFDRRYAGARRIAGRRRSLLALRLQCARAAHAARVQAVDGAADGLLVEWDAVAAACAGLPALARVGAAVGVLAGPRR
jgi:glycosyltransferase involved in cell wall biosynthesis